MKILGSIKALEIKIAKPGEDNRVDAIADFLTNGLEHGSDDDGVYHLQHEFGLRHEVAKKLVDGWLKKYHTNLHATPAETHPFIESIIKMSKVAGLSPEMAKILKAKIDRYAVAGYKLSKSKKPADKQLSHQLAAAAQTAEEIYHEDPPDAEHRIKAIFLHVPLPSGY